MSKVYDNFDDFFDFYLKEIEKRTGINVASGKYDFGQVDRLFKPTQDEVDALVEYAYKNNPVMKNVGIKIKVRNSETFYSFYSNKFDTFYIVLPNQTVLLLKYPELLDAALMHEMGHILFGDCTLVVEKGHTNDCYNICMDVRINGMTSVENIDRLSAFLSYNKKARHTLHPDRFYTEVLNVDKPITPQDFNGIHILYHYIKGNGITIKLNPEDINIILQEIEELESDSYGGGGDINIEVEQNGSGGEEIEGDEENDTRLGEGEGEGSEGSEGGEDGEGSEKGKGKGEGVEDVEGGEEGEGSEKGKGKEGEKGKEGGGKKGVIDEKVEEIKDKLLDEIIAVEQNIIAIEKNI
jgi:hypothetical protein